MSKHYVNETGTDLILDTGVLIGTATFYYIKYKAPGGATGTWAAELYDSYSALAKLTGTYLLKYTLDYGDLNTPGEWRFQASIGAIDGSWYGEMIKETIFDQFQ